MNKKNPTKSLTVVSILVEYTQYMCKATFKILQWTLFSAADKIGIEWV